MLHLLAGGRRGDESTLVCVYCLFGSHCMSSGSTEGDELGNEKEKSV